jgi:GntR family transcriptional regulator
MASRATRKQTSARSSDAGSNFFNPFPRYLQIRRLLIRRLAEGFSPGDRFPTEHELCGEFGVSRETVREALAGLETQGYIKRHRGRATTVLRLPDRTNDERLTGLVEDFTELKLNTYADVVSARIQRAPLRVASALNLKRDKELFRILRLRHVDGSPFACHETFLPIAIGNEIARLDLSHTTLFRELGRTLALKLTEIYQHIDAVPADPVMAKLLQIDVGAPLLVTRRAVGHDGSGSPTMLFETYFRADRYYYSVQVNKAVGKSSQKDKHPPRRKSADAKKLGRPATPLSIST